MSTVKMKHAEAEPSASYLPRPAVVRRADYEPTSPEEEFIVPLLRECIERAIARYAVPVPPEGRALDVGCARQPFRKTLESLGYSYTGLDVQQNPEGTVDVICGIDEPLPVGLISRGPFQFVLCTEVMEHVADWDLAFRNLAELAAPGGRLLITCPHFYQLHEEPHDFWRPTLHVLSYYAHRVGLQVLDQQAAGDAWDVLGTLLANCSPASKSHRLLDRGLAKLVRLSQRWLFNLLRARRLQKMIHLRSPLYLSNVVVLQRP
jgi:SAM-dependent methyltransferase